MSFSLPPPPVGSGAYRWFYADVVAGELTAVFIFMLGSIFSPRYSRAAIERRGTPLEHCSVNVAIYERGRRKLWLLHEYPEAHQEGSTLRIGRSSFAYRDGKVAIEIDEPGASLRAALMPECPPLGERRLCAAEPHYWELRAARGEARLELGGRVLSGRGYHDTNHGEVRLGAGLRGWSWSRTHGETSTRVVYRLPGVPPLTAVAGKGTSRWDEESVVLADSGFRKTGWGLSVPTQLEAPGRVRLVESSPFYARLEAGKAEIHALAEVAHFERFHSPWIRWMAHFRTRRMVVDKRSR